MDSRTFCAYNETSKCFLSTRVTVLDAAVEPLKTLKVLVEGPGSDCSSGLWLIRFRGVPVARTFSPFDLIYLDKDFRVVHGVELTVDSRFEPFKGQPASALILPSKTIVASRTRTGNQINLREVVEVTSDAATIEQPGEADAGIPQTTVPTQEIAAPNSRADTQPSATLTAQSAAPLAQNTSAPEQANHPEPSIPPALHLPSGQQSRPVVERPPIANIPARVVPASAQSVHPSSEVGPSARSADAAPSGRLLKTAHTEGAALRSDPKTIAEQTPSSAGAPAQSPQATIIPFPVPKVPAKPERAKPGSPGAAPQPASAEKTLSPSAESASQTPAQPFGKDLRGKIPQGDAALIPASQVKRKLKWDIRLLYLFFPEFDPEQESEFRLPRADFLNEAKATPAGPSAKLRFLSWLYPELDLKNAEKTRREDRAAPRVSNPGLVGYFFTGGHSRPHEIKDISVSGFYMYTDERWLPGTIIRVTLQVVGSRGDHPADTITVHSRVVRWGKNGGGFEFVLPGFVD